MFRKSHESFKRFRKNTSKDAKANKIIEEGFLPQQYSILDFKQGAEQIANALNHSDIDTLIVYVGESLAATIKDTQKSNAPRTISLFDDKNRPQEIKSEQEFLKFKLDCMQYIRRILKCGTPNVADFPLPLSEESVVAHLKNYILCALANMQNCIKQSKNKFILNSQNVLRFILASFLVTNKLIFDDQFKNSKKCLAFSSVDQIDMETMYKLELEFITLCDYTFEYGPRIIEGIEGLFVLWRDLDKDNDQALFKMTRQAILNFIEVLESITSDLSEESSPLSPSSSVSSLVSPLSPPSAVSSLVSPSSAKSSVSPVSSSLFSPTGDADLSLPLIGESREPFPANRK